MREQFVCEKPFSARHANAKRRLIPKNIFPFLLSGRKDLRARAEAMIPGVHSLGELLKVARILSSSTL